MTEARWRAAWDLYHEAAGLAAGERREFVESAAADEEVGRKVLTMLEALEAQPSVTLGKSFGSEPSGWPETSGREWQYMGQTLGRFEVKAPLARGGMGEVYSALDTDLMRTVAMKFLPAASIGSTDDVKRVLREARAVAALNHPGVVTVYEVIRHESSLAIVMELVEGVALRKLCGEPRPVGEVAGWGQQIAGAIAEAHARGIIHRDVKPENVMLRGDGIIKVLDFGLARHIDGESLQSAASLPVGTLRYMSPEQIRGEELSGASDVFSLGIVLYELATGSHPFAAESALETTHLILSRDAAVPSAVDPSLPGAFDAVVQSMLAKQPGRRPDAATVASALHEIHEHPSAELAPVGIPVETAQAAAAAVEPSVGRRRLLVAGVVLAIIGTAAGGILWDREAPISESATTPVLNGAPLTSSLGVERQPAFSPDGRRIAYIWNGGPDPEFAGIYVKAIGSGSPLRLSEKAAGDYNPAWSPSGDQIAFLRPSGTRAGVMIVPSAGGTPREVAKVDLLVNDPKRQLTWSPREDELLLSDVVPDSRRWRLQTLNLATGGRREITSPPPGWKDVVPQYSPDGRYLSFVRYRTGSSEMHILETAGGKRGIARPYRLRLDEYHAWHDYYAWNADSRKITFIAGLTTGRNEVWEADVVTKQPRRLPFTFGGVVEGIAISGVGERIAWVRPLHDIDIWVQAIGSGSGARRLIASSRMDDEPRYSPDGKRIAFHSRRSGGWEIWISDADGSNPRQVTSQRAFCGSPGWSPDGSEIVFDAQVSGFSEIWTVSAEGGEARRVLSEPINGITPSYSQDGEWIYFSAVRDGLRQVCKVPRRGGALEQVTVNGGIDPRESFDGRFLYYGKRATSGVWRMPVSGGPEERVPGTEAVESHRHWDVGPEGIYFFDPEPEPTIRVADAGANRVREFAPVWEPSPSGRGLSVAPDGGSFLLSRNELARYEIVVADGFPH